MSKKLRTILFFGLGVVITIAVIITPWKELACKVGVDPFRTCVPATLKTTCLVGKCKVFLDGQDKGETPLELLDITPGEHVVKLERISVNEGFYTTISKKINFLRGTVVYVEWEIGPSEIFSQGHTLGYEERKHSSEPVLSMNSTLSDVSVSIDGVDTGQLPFLGYTEDLEEGNHKISLSKEGYVTREIEVDINYKYTSLVDVDLMALPLEVE